MRAADLKVGESCRYNNVGCTRVASESETVVALVTTDFNLLFVNLNEAVRSAFDFEGVERPEGDRAIVSHVINCIDRVQRMSELSFVNQHWEEKMKLLAAEILKPGSEETITDLHALDYIWNLSGDYVIGGGQIYHARAIDYYLGRMVKLVFGEGKLMKIAYDYADKRLPEADQKWFGHGHVWLTDKDNEFNLPSRGIHYGIALQYPCECGKVKYDMFAIPGVHTGAFAYLVSEQSDEKLDVRNHCRVCEDCAPKIKSQLQAIGRGRRSEL
jgi:hypothetical protein